MMQILKCSNGHDKGMDNVEVITQNMEHLGVACCKVSRGGFIAGGAGVTERNSYGLRYHNRQLDSINQSFPICNRNKNI